ncbi:nitrilase-related carbon-nitrogen hydrolase [Candidatus Xianfuyuplasma coldseepsis]|uniref:Carbon-nitrogen hydrolase family protein n=1 Tax=Candidatus Xianfuyuplasma coldseepsis TaxID=2782163 RepID=A0A7L7KTB5_9MOLU|nr:nitrilase-related carbon-nitrogen hydrolase [Xianfuyuplasma coldseepsis]QMS85639.1 carbon-nitrogen hydrolase family protein [Xianfuyuplasma coldseepsis]
MKITLVQHQVLPTKEENMKRIEQRLEHPLHTDMIILGEMCLSPYENELFESNSIAIGDTHFQRFQALAKQQQAYLVAGSVPEWNNNRLYNTTFVFNPMGECIASYRKMHLFSITYPTGESYDEGDQITPGKDLVTFNTPWGTIGLMICFDIRFPEQAARLQEMGAKLLLVPAAFNQYTGPKHWTLAFRSRAVDNQLFTIGVSPSDNSHGTYNYYGHSIVVDPFGEVLFEADGKPIIHTVSIDLNDVEKIKKAFPILSNKIVL